MARFALFSGILAFAGGVAADYDEFSFTNEPGSWLCPGNPYGCPPPSICVHENLLNKWYCCGVGESNAVCWGPNTDCQNSNNEPGSAQIGCDSGDNAFCCLKDKEECTQRTNQINICWATPTNPFTNITAKKMNDTFSSLSSAHPRQSSFTVDLAALTASSTPISVSATATSVSVSQTPSTSASTSASSSPSSSQSSSSDSGISGGAIGGIVVGVVGGLALIGAGGFFMWRRGTRKSAHGNELDGTGNPYMGTNNGYGAVAQSPPQEKYAHHMGPIQTAPAEMDAASNIPVSEMEGSKPDNPVNGVHNGRA